MEIVACAVLPAPVIVTVHAPAAEGVTVKDALGPDALALETEAMPLHVSVSLNVPEKPV